MSAFLADMSTLDSFLETISEASIRVVTLFVVVGVPWSALLARLGCCGASGRITLRHVDFQKSPEIWSFRNIFESPQNLDGPDEVETDEGLLKSVGLDLEVLWSSECRRPADVGVDCPVARAK
jgi:hypothetical protein